MVGEYDLNTAIFGVREYISKMSHYLTLVPGDILWMGTDGATENMKDGDVCDITINGIGTLSNPGGMGQGLISLAAASPVWGKTSGDAA